MGGFTINGFGAADSYYPIRPIGEFYCSDCKKNKPFSLMELRMKIRVLFIPTVTINTKYAVVCEHCHSGYYVDEQTKDDILQNRVHIQIADDGLIIKKLSAASPAVQQSAPALVGTAEETQNRIPSVTQSPPLASDTCDCEDIKIPVQAAVQYSEKAAVPRPEKTSAPKPSVTRVVKQCPACQLLFRDDKSLCPICGQKLVERK